MNEPVIPDASNEPEPSAAVVALRKEVHLAQSAVFALGEMPIKAKEAAQAAELLAYLDKRAAEKIAELDSLIASEIVGQPVRVENGSKLSVAH